MRHIRRQLAYYGKPALAALLIGIILLIDAMAVCPALHEWLHKNADSPDHHCAVTTLAHGKVSAAHCEIVIPPPTAVIQTVQYFTISVFSPAIDNLPPGRGPPALSSVS